MLDVRLDAYGDQIWMIVQGYNKLPGKFFRGHPSKAFQCIVRLANGPMTYEMYKRFRKYKTFLEMTSI